MQPRMVQLCIREEPTDAAETPAQPKPVADRSSHAQRIDEMRLERERVEEQLGPPASADELALHLPPWAQQLMLDPEANEEYEAAQVRARAKTLYDNRVVGRTWEGDDLVHDASAYGGYGDEAGVPHYTVEELADDYRLPVETVCAQLLELGVTPQQLQIRTPVKSFCSSQQLAQLAEILTSADPIAARESYVDLTLRELAEERVTELSADQLLWLCKKNKIAAVLGVETRVLVDDYDLLLELADREAAFLRGRTGE